MLDYSFALNNKIMGKVCILLIYFYIRVSKTGFADDDHIIIGSKNPAPLALSGDIFSLQN